MAKDRNEKYKQSFHTMIRKIIDAESDSEAWSDESLDGNIQVVSSDGSDDLQEEEVSLTTESIEEDSVVSSGSLHSLGSEHTLSFNEYRTEALPFNEYRTEDLDVYRNLGKTVRKSEFCTTDTNDIINPLSKLRRKKPSKKCQNFDE